MRRLLVSLAIIGCVGITPAAGATPLYLPQLALGPVAGTTGFGVQASVPLLPGRLDLNSGISGFGLTRDITADGTKFHGKLNIGAIPVFLSLYPWRFPFHLDAGFFINNNRLSVIANAPANTNVSINGHHYHQADIGTLSGRTRFSPVAPYLGFGFGAPFQGGPLSFTLNAGVMFEGSPNIRLAASNPAITLVPGATQDIASEERTLNNKARIVQFYPVLNLGLVYRF